MGCGFNYSDGYVMKNIFCMKIDNFGKYYYDNIEIIVNYKNLLKLIVI